ncbi:uncharacterized protein VTP21DRAFT_719 [Calcarisporiella thermophila]|uniref:uncharacterized protein n=1 Tax=Calcarisporiella thermophila TaxID=911321 RepID=UPI0037440B92
MASRYLFSITAIFLLLTASALFLASVVLSDEILKKPNIVFILTDDQDARLNSIDFMPKLQSLLVKQGISFTNHYTTVSLCCPARVSILRGQYAHNHNVTDVSPPYGGYPQYAQLDLGNDALPVWLQASGYDTYFIGKYMNTYGVKTYNKPTPQGWTDFDGLVDPYTYDFENVWFAKNGNPPQNFPGKHQTEVIIEKAKTILEHAGKNTKPFFLYLSPVAPHNSFIYSNGSIKVGAPVPLPRHKQLFEGVKVPRTGNFNPSGENEKPSWLRNLPPLTESQINEVDSLYRARLQSLQGIDDLVETVYNSLKEQNQLDNTYIFYSSDNGFHLGQHRIFSGKTLPYEEDINVPLIVRGPGVKPNQINNRIGSHHDLAPTFVTIAGGKYPEFVDGGVISEVLSDSDRNRVSENQITSSVFAAEFWGEGLIEYVGENLKGSSNNTYRALRIHEEDADYLYTVWCTQERELYDLKKDPDQLHNLYRTADRRLLLRLDALLFVLKRCKGDQCRNPWRTLHPSGEVGLLNQALQESFDQYYEELPKVSFTQCPPGQFLNVEGGPYDFNKHHA